MLIRPKKKLCLVQGTRPTLFFTAEPNGVFFQIFGKFFEYDKNNCTNILKYKTAMMTILPRIKKWNGNYEN